MAGTRRARHRRACVDEKVAELIRLAKELCPEATITADPIRYEEEDGFVDIRLPSEPSEEDHDRIVAALADHTAKVYDETGLFLIFAVLY